MSGFFGKLFGKKEATVNTPVEFVEGVLTHLLEVSGLALSFEVFEDKQNKEQILVEIFGEDEELLRAREGQLIDAIQLFLTRACQNQMKEEKVIIHVDNEGFRDKANLELTELAEKLKNVALEKGKPVYFRALPPRDRKVIHQYLAEDARVKSRSIGEGLYKKIKIFPQKSAQQNDHESDIDADDDSQARFLSDQQ
jgi:spoIIIJ-associated protein